MKNEIQFDMEAAIQALHQGKDLSGKDGVLPPPDQAADRSGNEGGAGRPPGRFG